MLYDYMKKYDMDYLGCVVIIDDIPNLFIIYNDDILEGLPLFDDDNQYSIINDNDIVIVAVSIYHDDEKVSISFVDDENVSYMKYNIMPLYIHTLKTDGITVDDVLYLGFFDILAFNVLDEFLKETAS